MRLLLLNQFGLASGAPTGRILAELGAELEQQGHEVHLLTTGAGYGKPRRGRRRLVEEGLAHLLLLWRGLAHRRVDAVISLTSPACLAVTAGLLARIHRARHFHWSMDLYPDLGVQLGELKPGALVRGFAALMRRAYRQATRVVTLDEDMRDYLLKNYGVDSTVIAPFPPDVTWPALKPSPATRRWLYSGNFGRAHEIEVLLQIQKLLEDCQVPAELILQGKGPQFLSSQEAARRLGLHHVHWHAPVPQEQLGESLAGAEVLVVTRKAELKGLLLPSKLVLAELSGRTVLWIGDTDGKTAQRLSREGHGVFTSDDVGPIAAWLQALFQAEYPHPPREARDTRSVRQQAVAQWETLFQP